jgi:SAM-dependent methyltransferase
MRAPRWPRLHLPGDGVMSGQRSLTWRSGPRSESHRRPRCTSPSEADDYDRYVRAEWELFARDPTRSTAALDAATGLRFRRVLDVGCGAGQELRPFLRDPSTLGIGIDLSPETGLAGRELFARAQAESRVAFVRAAAECLPFGTSSVDVIICRLALPYMDNKRALSEMARVLRPGGILFLKFHHARYYVREIAEAFSAGRIRRAIHAWRVLVSGTVYHLTGLQPRSWLTGRETFQTMWLLRRLLSRHGLEVRGVLGDSVPAAPNLLIERRRV